MRALARARAHTHSLTHAHTHMCVHVGYGVKIHELGKNTNADEDDILEQDHQFKKKNYTILRGFGHRSTTTKKKMMMMFKEGEGEEGQQQ